MKYNQPLDSARESSLSTIGSFMQQLTDKQKELYENLFWDLRRMYQNSMAWADNGIPFRQVIEDFILNVSQPAVEADAQIVALLEE